MRSVTHRVALSDFCDESTNHDIKPRLHTLLLSNVNHFLCKAYRANSCGSIESKSLKIGQKLGNLVEPVNLLSRLHRCPLIYLQRGPQKPSNVKSIICKTYRMSSCRCIKFRISKSDKNWSGYWQSRGTSQFTLPAPSVPSYNTRLNTRVT